MKEKYKIWSVYVPNPHPYGLRERTERNLGGWLLIPPSEKYIPDWYPKNALVKKHEEELLPPPSYWLKPEYEEMVYNNNY